MAGDFSFIEDQMSLMRAVLDLQSWSANAGARPQRACCGRSRFRYVSACPQAGSKYFDQP